MKRILILAPHTDDGELGCGGSIVRYLEEGKEVFFVAFSTCEESVPDGYPKDILRTELINATAILGIKMENLIVLNYQVRKFSYVRQEILEEMVSVRKQINPDLVLMPSIIDLHQDHMVVATEGMRAFKNCTVLGYELPWNHTSFSTQAFVQLEERHILKKWEALQCYQTQIQEGRPYFNEDFIRGLAAVRGVQAGKKFAEAFEIRRVVF